MTFCIITHVSHHQENNDYFAYSPYVREMNIWAKYVDKILLVAPLDSQKPTSIDAQYYHSNIDFRKVPKFDFLNFKSAIKTLLLLPKISFEIYNTMKKSDHIHLRCPGNMGLLGCMLQIFFPKKPKTAKYAGNWDPKAKQPLTYKFQKWILSNTFLTKNMQVLVYGEWEHSCKNIKPFFTATYHEADKIATPPRDLNGLISFLFVGTLTEGKQPLYAIQLVETLKVQGHKVQLSIYGEGKERGALEQYILENKLESFVFLKGNRTQAEITQAYQESHFVVLPSKSEGWPKVIAEGMFWGCLPLATKVSCVPNMLDNGNRGVLLTMNMGDDMAQITTVLKFTSKYQDKAVQAMNWSRKYTLDVFENEIKMLLQP